VNNLSELEDQVEQIFATVEELREVAGDGPATRKLLDSLFRTVHSLKASATSNGLNSLGATAHEFENLLHSLRTGKTTLDTNTLQLLSENADSLSEGLTLQSPSTFEIPADIWTTLKEDEKHTLKQSVNEGATLFLVQTSFDVADFDQQFQKLKELLASGGEVISTAPKVDTEAPGKINFRILYASTADTLRELSGISDVTAEEISVPLPPKSVVAQKRHAPDSVRISLEDLDRIISSTHKLYRQTTNSPGEASGLERALLELSAELVSLRMVTAEKLLSRALRAGRSAATGKEIEFEVRGQALLLDKSLSEAIADPLVHLVRNAVDHGIENTDVRVQLGKPRPGRIIIEAASFQGQTRIAVTDDGRGIDPAIVEKAAKRLGIVDPDAVVNTEKCVRLLFRAGFSTALEVSNISGRGVGLDVVETGVEEVGGSVRVSSQTGKGSTFEIRLPVTFGFLDVVPVSVAGRRYLIDATHVTSKSTNETKPIPLGSLLGQGSDDQQGEGQTTLVCRFADRGSVVLSVDEIGETQPALIRGLGSRSGRWFGVAGASEMRDGSVVLLLDLPQLVSRGRSNHEFHK
jgi:two-component system, chemotaxis family, sensor kinase CheA